MKYFKLIVLACITLTASINIASAQTSSTTETEVVSESATSKIINVKVKGITCGNDHKTIISTVEKVKGISTCEATKHGATTTFKINFNPSLITEKEVHAAIENVGGCSNPNDRPYKVKG